MTLPSASLAPASLAPDNPLRGMGLILLAMLCFSASDAMAKLLSASLPPIEMAWIRYTVFVAMSATMLRRTKSSIMVRNPVLQVLRGLMLVGSAVFFMSATRIMPLAEASAIGFISPVLITLLAAPMLGERVGPLRWAAVVLGLVGVMTVIRPGTDTFQPGALFSAASSLVWAVGVILTRKMSGAQAAATLVWSAVTGLLVLTLALPFDFVWPTWGQFGFGLAIGVVASSGQMLLVLAYRLAPASLLAPFSYTQLLWAIVNGYFLFHALPDLLTVVGGAIIAVSGLIAARPDRIRASRAA